jgi:uncharacterized protein YbjT (DUF2867 family)
MEAKGQVKEAVLVLGGTGTLGVPVVRSLTGRGHDVRVLTRSAKKEGNLFGPEVETLEGDPANREHLRQALDGCHAVHVSLPTGSELVAVQHLVDLADGSKAKNLKRVSYISGTSVREENRWFQVIDVKIRAEACLRESGIPHTVFCPTWVMEVIPNFVRSDRAVLIEGKSDPGFSFFAAADFGRMVAASYEDHRALGKRLFIHGPRSITLREAIKSFHEACAAQARLMRLRPWQAIVLARLTRNPSLGAVARLIAYFDTTEEHGDPTEANALLGAPEISLEKWIQSRTLKPTGD